MRVLAVVVCALGLPAALPPAPAQAAPLYGETYLVSTSHEDKSFGPESEFAAISQDGSHAFWTTTESLLSSDSDNDNVDIYERIVDARTTRLVTPGGDFDATFLGSSEDGSKVFFSTAESIVADGDAEVDLYRRNLDDVPPTTTNMTPGTDEFVRFEGIDLAGDRLFFESDETLTGGDADEETDVYMSQDGSLTKVSPGNDECAARYTGSTPDGLNVFFLSEEVLTGEDDGSDTEFTCRTGFDDSGTPDIFHWSGGSVTNRTPTGGCNFIGHGCASDNFVAASEDGSRVIFNSGLYHFWTSTCNSNVYQAAGGTLTLLSPSQYDDSADECIPGKGYYDALAEGVSDDAKTVYWITREPGMAGAPDEHKDIFMNTNGGAPELVSPNTPDDDADFAWNTPDGSHLFFATSDPVVDDGDTFSDVFQNVGGVITKVSKGPLGGNGPGNAFFSGATDDAEYVFFQTGEQLTSEDQNSGTDLYVRHNNETELVSTGPRAGTGSYSGNFDDVSENAERVFFTTAERLVTADTNEEEDVYMRWVGGPPSVRIDELALTPDAFVELLKSGEGEEEFPDEDAPYKIVVYDGDGDELGEHAIAPALLRGQARPLFSDTHPDKDEPLGVVLPAVGQMCFTQGADELMVDCVAWGCIAAPVQQDIAKVAPPEAGLSQQRQGDAPEVFHLATPTPKAVSVAGTTPPACPSDPDPDPGSGSDGGGGGADAGGGDDDDGGGGGGGDDAPQPSPLLPSDPEGAPGEARGAGLARFKGQAVFLSVKCSGPGACGGLITLTARKSSQRKAGRRGTRRARRSRRRSTAVVVGRSRFAIAAGKRRVVRIRLNRKGKTLLRKAGKRGLRLKLAGTGVRPRTVVIKPAESKRKRKQARGRATNAT